MVDTLPAVTAGVQAYADAEAGLRAAHDALLKLPATYRAVFAANPTPAAIPSGAPGDPNLYPGRAYGYIESERDCARAVGIAGKVAELLGVVLENHSEDTYRAKELGVDIPMPPGIHPDGGGR